MRLTPLALLLSYTLFLFHPLTTHAVPMFSGGDGTSGDPYQISTCTDLQAINSFLDKDFILINDIDCSATSGWNSGSGFLPIGTLGTAFTGSLDGNGHIIEDLTINRAGSAYLGLFTHINTGAEIHDLGLVNARILDSSSYTGLLVGIMNDGSIDRVFTTGETSAPGASYNSGLIGNMVGGTVTDVFSRAIVSSSGYSAGIVGAFDGGTITNAYATGANSGFIKQGLVVHFGGTVTNSFYDSTTTGASDDDGNGKPRSTAQMKAVATYTLTGSAGLSSPWDFVSNPNNDVGNNDYWSIDPTKNNGYPYLTNVRLAGVFPETTTVTTTGGFKTYPIQTTDNSPLTVFIDKSNAATIITDKNTVAITTNADPTTILEYVIASNPDLLNAPRHLYKTPITIPTSNEAKTYFIRFYSTTNVPSELFKRTIVRAEIIAIVPTNSTETKPPTSTPEQLVAPAPTQIITESAPKKQIFTRDLRLGMRGEDVRALQIFLNKNGFTISKRGAGSPGNESTYFGAATRIALAKFQEANAESILRPFKLTRGTGIFIGNTRALITAQQ